MRDSLAKDLLVVLFICINANHRIFNFVSDAISPQATDCLQSTNDLFNVLAGQVFFAFIRRRIF